VICWHVTSAAARSAALLLLHPTYILGVVWRAWPWRQDDVMYLTGCQQLLNAVYVHLIIVQHQRVNCKSNAVKAVTV
jgi:hypothetical protein